GDGGRCGEWMRLLRRRRAKSEEFRPLVAEVICRLEAIPAAERMRWLELLTYLNALVYNMREPKEREGLGELIERSVGTDELRQEGRAMKRTIADALKDEGRNEGKIEGKIEGQVGGKGETRLK